jgi:hypothetical protein
MSVIPVIVSKRCTKLKDPLSHLKIVTDKIVSSKVSSFRNGEDIPMEITTVDFRLVIRFNEPTEIDGDVPPIEMMYNSGRLPVNGKLAVVGRVW